jgi:hypothetical protein
MENIRVEIVGSSTRCMPLRNFDICKKEKKN